VLTSAEPASGVRHLSHASARLAASTTRLKAPSVQTAPAIAGHSCEVGAGERSCSAKACARLIAQSGSAGVVVEPSGPLTTGKLCSGPSRTAVPLPIVTQAVTQAQPISPALKALGHQLTAKLEKR
jgi:hypothetical protein